MRTLALLILMTGLICADEIRLKNGGVVRGRVVGEFSGRLRVETGSGYVDIPQDEILEIKQETTDLNRYQDMYEKIKARRNPDDFEALARWSKVHKLSKYHSRLLKTALRLREEQVISSRRPEDHDALAAWCEEYGFDHKADEYRHTAARLRAEITREEYGRRVKEIKANPTGVDRGPQITRKED